MSPAAPALEIAGLDAAYSGHEVLRDVDLRVEAGEVVALLGPNGAGKTSLFRTITGRLSPRAGQVRIGGWRPGRVEARRRLGLVPQDLAIYAHLSPRENLTVFARLAGLRGRALRRAVDSGLDVARLRDRADELCSRLSGGYQRRVNVAAAILHHPDLLLLDEPTAGVDAEAAGALLRVIEELAGSGMAVLMASHDLVRMQRFAHRVAFLSRGRLLRYGPPGELLRQAYGDARTVMVQLGEEPGEEAESALRGAGLAPAGEEGVWRGRVAGDLERAGGILTRLAPLQDSLVDIHVAQPDLHDLFRDLTQDPGTQQ
jgi:ABC-2 type transport system ATP-binding protein